MRRIEKYIYLWIISIFIMYVLPPITTKIIVTAFSNSISLFNLITELLAAISGWILIIWIGLSKGTKE